jgi:hypothetical protein
MMVSQKKICSGRRTSTEGKRGIMNAYRSALLIEKADLCIIHSPVFYLFSLMDKSSRKPKSADEKPKKESCCAQPLLSTDGASAPLTLIA